MTVMVGLVDPIVEWVAGIFGLHPALEGWNFALALLLAHLAVLRWIEGVSWDYAWLGSRALDVRRIAQSFLVGGAAIAIPCLLLLAIGWFTRGEARPGSGIALAGRAALFFLPYALSEELMVRGYVMAVLRESLGWKTALGATSVIFGLLHVFNPGVSVLAIVLVTLAGVFLGGVVLVTGSIYAAWAAHFAWNWTLAAVLHASVSGLPFSAVDYRLVDSGPDWATGGLWGPEGGVAAGIGMLASLVFLFSRPAGRALLGEGRAH